MLMNSLHHSCAREGVRGCDPFLFCFFFYFYDFDIRLKFYPTVSKIDFFLKFRAFKGYLCW